MTQILNRPEVGDLAALVEEVARSTEEGVKRFVEPASGTLRRASLKRHHIVFGRRGSGKTSLLRKAAADLTVDRRPIAFVDLEPFKGHSYPDVLISVLIASFTRFQEWLNTAAVHSATKTSFWNRLFGAKPKRPSFNREQAAALAGTLGQLARELDTVLKQADNAELQRVTRRDQERARERHAGLGISAAGSASVGVTAGVTAGATDTTRAGDETQEVYRRSKIDLLHSRVMEYRDILRTLTAFGEGPSFLFLDDLYHIRRADQAQVLDYFHRIAKGNNLWLKIGTIQHRSRWYVHGDPPIGLKLGDDADKIDLDLTLEKYSLTKGFLTTILKNLVQECSAPLIGDFVTPGALDRLVLASGGVARDFLGVFRRSISEARERLERDSSHYRGPKIGAEDVNVAAGKYGDVKLEEFSRDTQEDQGRLEEAFARIRVFCILKANANCFLLDQDARGTDIDLIQELVDLRLVHRVRTGVTVSGRIGKRYNAYMLDVSQYTGSRKRRQLEMVEFWTRGSRERLRRASLIYVPQP